MNKQELETAILKHVYELADFVDYCTSDKPDVRLRREGGQWFGVEITELFPSATDARIHTDPDYIGQVLGGQPVKHRDDLPELALSRMTITSEDGSGSSSTVHGIFRQSPGQIDHYEDLAKAIVEKNLKARDYDAELDHINLIVFDHYPTSAGPEHRYSVSEVLTEALRGALDESPFREVFWVSAERGGRRVYRPLNAVILLDRFHGYLSALNEWLPDNNFEVDELALLFAHVATKQGTDISLVRDQDGWIAYRRGWGVRATSTGVQLADMVDQVTPSFVPLGEPIPGRLSLSDFVDFEANFRAGRSLECEVVFNARPVPEYS